MPSGAAVFHFHRAGAFSSVPPSRGFFFRSMMALKRPFPDSEMLLLGVETVRFPLPGITRCLAAEVRADI
jgi:hypothetical protein